MSAHQPDSARSAWSRVVALPIALTVAVSVIVLAFLWPALTSEPRDLPLVATGADAQVTALVDGIDEHAPGVFDVTTVDDRAAAVAAIEHRQAYGAIVLGQQPEVLTSSAASPIVAQTLSGIAGQLQGMLQQAAAAQAAASGAPAPTITVAVTDVVPLADSDPRGAGLASAVLPLVIGGLIGGVLATLAIPGRMRRLAALAGYAVLAGLTVAGILQGWLGVLQGSYLANASAITLAVFGIAAAVAGLAAVIGRAGLAVGAVTLVLFAVPLASSAAPVEFLPVPWGAVGQWFPPGAGATLLRELSYFPDAEVTMPWLVLAGWVAAGALLLVLGRRGSRSAEPATAS
jgi:hypothetical protein